MSDTQWNLELDKTLKHYLAQFIFHQYECLQKNIFRKNATDWAIKPTQNCWEFGGLGSIELQNIFGTKRVSVFEILYLQTELQNPLSRRCSENIVLLHWI